MVLLRRGAGVAISEEVTKVRSIVRYFGKEVMMLLLDRRGADVPITEEVVKAIVAGFVCSAAYSGDAIIVQQIVDFGPTDMVKSEMYVEALQLACLRGHLDVVDKLLSVGVDPNQVDEHGWT